MQESNTQEEKKEEPKLSVESQGVPQEETQEEINWKKYREDNKKNKKAREDAEEKAAQKAQETEDLKRALEEVVNKKTYSHEQEDEDEDESTRINKEVERILAIKDSEREKARAEKELTALPQKLASSHKDFNDVCSEDNLLYFEYHFSDLATSFKYMPDSFEKWDNLYKAIKRVMPDASKKKHYDAVAEKNLNAPKSHATAAGAPKSTSVRAGLSQEAKNANWLAMKERMK
jgi:hypothetical protein